MSGEKFQGGFCFWVGGFCLVFEVGASRGRLYIMERMTSNVSEVPSSAVSMGSEIAFMQDCSGELKKTKIHFDIVAQLGNMVHRL